MYLFRVQSSIKVMDAIAYLKAQAIAQRNASSVSGPAASSLHMCDVNARHLHTYYQQRIQGPPSSSHQHLSQFEVCILTSSDNREGFLIIFFIFKFFPKFLI